MRRLAACFCGVALLLLEAACSGDDGGGAAATQPASTGAPQATATRPAQTASPAATAPAPQVANEPVGLQAADGTVLRGHLYAAPGPLRKVLLIVSAAEQRTWSAHVADFAARGIAVLTLDMRGVGETGGSSDSAKLAGDISLAILYLRSREYPLVYALGIGVREGAGALRAAAQQELAGVAALPTGTISAAEIAQVSEPKLLMAFESDAEALRQLDELMRAAADPKRRTTFSVPGMAPADVFSLPAVKQAVLDFVGN